MRYALSDREWQIIQPALPSKPRGVPRVDDRRLLNGALWVLQSGVPWRDLPDREHTVVTAQTGLMAEMCVSAVRPERPRITLVDRRHPQHRIAGLA